MSAHIDNLLRMFGARDVAVDVEAGCIGLLVRRHLQMNPRRALGSKTFQQQGILNRNRRCRNLRQIGLFWVVNRCTGVRRLHRQRRHGTHQDGHRSERSRTRGTCRAIHDRLPVPLINLIEDDNLAFDTGTPEPVECRKIGHNDDLGRKATRRCADAHAQPQHVQRLDDGCDQVGRFRPAHPTRHHHRLHGDVLQARLPHGLRSPGGGAGQRFRSGQPLANMVAKVL